MDQGSPGARVLALTSGDPSGIGPEIAAAAWRRRREDAVPPFYLLGDPALMRARAPDVRLALVEPREAANVFSEALPVVPLKAGFTDAAGLPDTANAAGIIEAIERAVAEVNAIADFDVLVEYVKGGRGGGVVSIKFKPVTKSHSRLIEAAATKSAVARRKKSPDRHTVDMLDGQTWEERRGPAEVSLDAVEEARRLLPEGMEVKALLSEWREVNRGRALREPDMLFLNWVRARIEQEGDPLLKDIDADVFGALLSGRE